MKFNFPAFIVHLVIPLAVGAAGSFFTAHSVNTWYTTLSKPSFNPPNTVFGPVWTALYILIGISAYRVWQRRSLIGHFPRISAFYLIQLILNLMWSFIFFYARQPGLAFIEVLFLLAAIVINGVMFYRVDKTAGILFIPYFLWVSFAAVLTYSIYSLNS